MKIRYLAAFLLFFLAIASVAAYIKGDANGDGRVSVADMAIIASHIMGDNPANFNEKQADVNGDGRVSVADISALATLIMGGDVIYDAEKIKKDTIYIKYCGSTVTVSRDEIEDVQITYDQADVQATIGKNPNIVLCLSGNSEDGRLSINADTLLTLQLAGVELTSSHAPAINSYGKQKVNIELADGTKNNLRDSKTYTFSNADEVANGCLSAQGALTFTGNGELTLRGKSKHAIYSKKSITFRGGTYNVLEAASDAIHSSKSVTIEGGDFKLNGMKSEAIELDNDFTMEGGTIEMAITGAGAKGIQCGGDLNISGGTIQAIASGALKNKDGDLSYCSIIKCDGNATITNGEFHLTNNSPGGKCISIDDNLVIMGGILMLATNGDGDAYVNTEGITDYYTAKCLSSNNTIRIVNGELTCISTGKGAKGIVAENSLFIGSYSSIPVIKIETNGAAIVNDIINDERSGCPKAIKSNKEIYIYSGNISVSTKGMGGEGFECNGQMNVFGGNIQCLTYDDGINVGENLEINGGNIMCFSENNDGIDSNGRIAIVGGHVISMSNGNVDESFDTEEGQLFLAGGTAFGISPSDVDVATTGRPYYNTPFTTINNDRTRLSGLSVLKDKRYSICDENGKVIMSVRSYLTTDHAFFFASSRLLDEDKVYSIYESSSVHNPTYSILNDYYSEGGELSADASLVLRFFVTSIPNYNF